MLLTVYQSWKKSVVIWAFLVVKTIPFETDFNIYFCYFWPFSFIFWLIRFSSFSSSFLAASQYPKHKQSLLWQRVGCTFTTALRYFPHGSPCEVDLPSFFLESCVLVGLQLAVIVWEFIVEDGDGHAIQDYSKSNAQESKQATKVSFWTHISISHCRDADLQANQHTPY